MFENGRVMSLMRTVKGLQKCSMKAGQSLFSLFAHSPAHATRGSRIHRSPLEYRTRGFSVRPARIFEQKRDCSQSTEDLKSNMGCYILPIQKLTVVIDYVRF